MESCCCCCGRKSKRKVNNDDVDNGSDSDPSDPLIVIDGEKNESNKQVTKQDPSALRSSLVVQKSIGELEIDSSDESLSDLSGGIPDSPTFARASLFGNQSSTVGSIKIPDEVLSLDKSLKSLQRDVSIAAANISSKRNADEQIKRVRFEMGKTLDEVNERREDKKRGGG